MRERDIEKEWEKGVCEINKINNEICYWNSFFGQRERERERDDTESLWEREVEKVKERYWEREREFSKKYNKRWIKQIEINFGKREVVGEREREKNWRWQ